tara:strand:+ start:69 stop:401 length:333 start_codon:yes stop_codon:yes gene_type:complete
MGGSVQENDDIYKTNNKCQFTGLPIYFGNCDCYIHKKYKGVSGAEEGHSTAKLVKSKSHEVLQIEPPVTLDSIKKAYHKLCKIYHPDRPSGNHNEFIKINDAYNDLLLTY